MFVNVRPAKRGRGGAKDPTDPFYWRWLEFGWNSARRRDGKGNRGKRYRRRLGSAPKRVQGRGFLQAGVTKLGEALRVFSALLRPKLEQLNNKGATL